MRSFRWVWLGALLVLGGCNTVYSDKPLFGSQDAAGAPRLKPGIWLRYQALNGLFEHDCRVDPNKPVRKWPDCAGWVLVRETDLLTLGHDEGKQVWLSDVYVLANGRPRILQTTSRDITEGGARAPAEGEEPQSRYSGLVPIAQDANGDITAYRTWEAQCGPPDETEYPENSGTHPTTLAPLPGLTMSEDGQSCVVKDQDAVRRSVVVSEAWDTYHGEPRWIREPRPDDFAKVRRSKAK
jgi:hypothetical protein